MADGFWTTYIDISKLRKYMLSSALEVFILYPSFKLMLITMMTLPVLVELYPLLN